MFFGGHGVVTPSHVTVDLNLGYWSVLDGTRDIGLNDVMAFWTGHGTLFLQWVSSQASFRTASQQTSRCQLNFTVGRRPPSAIFFNMRTYHLVAAGLRDGGLRTPSYDGIHRLSGIWESVKCSVMLLATSSLTASSVVYRFLADRTNGRAYSTVLRLSSVCDVMYCG